MQHFITQKIICFRGHEIFATKKDTEGNNIPAIKKKKNITLNFIIQNYYKKYALNVEKISIAKKTIQRQFGHFFSSTLPLSIT